MMRRRAAKQELENEQLDRMNVDEPPSQVHGDGEPRQLELKTCDTCEQQQWYGAVGNSSTCGFCSRKNSTTTEETTADSDSVFIVYKGRASKMTMPNNEVITKDDIIESRRELTYEDSPEAQQLRESTQYNIESNGSAHAISPKRFTSVSKIVLSKLWTSHNMIKNFLKLFSGPRCKLQPISMRLIIAATTHISKGSDEGVEMLIAAVFKVVCIEMNVSVSGLQLAHGTPSAAHLRSWRIRLSAEMLMLACDEINQRGVTHGHLASDHGERGNQQAFVKGVSYGYIDENGEYKIKTITYDMDKCGHTKKEVVAGLKTLVDKIIKLCPNLVFISIEGDNGGGGGVEAVFEPLKKAGVLHKDSRYIICIMHAYNKCIETGVEKALGRAGMNMNDVLQLGFATIKAFRTVKEEGGLELLDNIKRLCIAKLVKDKKWKDEAAANCASACVEFLLQYDVEDLEEILFERNLQLPVWTRWKTTLAMAKFIVKNWMVNYFMLAAISDTKKASLAITKTAADALSLMKMKAEGAEAGSAPQLYAQACFLDVVSANLSSMTCLTRLCVPTQKLRKAMHSLHDYSMSCAIT